jgi:hypothetical protein
MTERKKRYDAVSRVPSIADIRAFGVVDRYMCAGVGSEIGKGRARGQRFAPWESNR